MTGRISKPLRAQAAIIPTSPAYAQGSTTTLADISSYTAKVIAENAGVTGTPDNRHTWYKNTSIISGIGGSNNPPEIIWRTDVVETNDLERRNFPPTLFGEGEINPTQNLVDAFPMANGYPIDDPASGFDPSNPYA